MGEEDMAKRHIESTITEYDLLKLAAENPAYIVTGHGRKGLFGNQCEMNHRIQSFLDFLDATHPCAKQQIVLLYGGDPYDPRFPDISHVLKRIQHERRPERVRIVAVQSDKVAKEWGGMNADDVDDVLFFKTDYDGETVPWSGKNAKGEAVGSSKVWFSPELGPHINGLVAFGGGPIAEYEWDQADKLGMQRLYYQCQVQNLNGHGPFGALHDHVHGVETVPEHELATDMLTDAITNALLA